MKIRLMDIDSMYVAGIHGKKLVKHVNFSKGQFGKILKGGCEDY